MVRLAVEDEYDKALIMSGDSDYVPAVTAVREMFKEKKPVGIVVPPSRERESDALKAAASFNVQMTETHCGNAILRYSEKLRDGTTITMPDGW